MPRGINISPFSQDQYKLPTFSDPSVETVSDILYTLEITQTSTDADSYYFDIQVKNADGTDAADIFFLHGWRSTSGSAPSYDTFIESVVTGTNLGTSVNDRFATDGTGLANVEVSRALNGQGDRYLWVFLHHLSYVSGAIAEKTS